jgi:hypothetical protein
MHYQVGTDSVRRNGLGAKAQSKRAHIGSRNATTTALFGMFSRRYLKSSTILTSHAWVAEWAASRALTG